MNKYRKRFEELEEQIIKLENSKYTSKDQYNSNSLYVDNQLFNELKIKVKNLIVNVCGKESEHYKGLIELERINYAGNYGHFSSLKSVFNAAKEDFLGGYLVSIKNIVQAELFDNELEQAKELLDKGFFIAAAVIAGVVLETRVRELCKENNIPISEREKLNKMNENLAKAGIYNT